MSKITGYVRTTDGKALPDAQVKLFVLKNGVQHGPIDEVPSGSHGEFELSHPDPQAGHSFKVSATINGKTNELGSLRGGEKEVVISLPGDPPPPPPFWQWVKELWRGLTKARRSVVLGSCAVALIIVIFLVFKSHPPPPPPTTQREIQIVLKSRNTNFTWKIVHQGLVYDLAVGLNGEPEQRFKNSNPAEGDPIVFEVPPIFHLLEYATLRINDEKSAQKLVLLNKQEVEVIKAADHLQECLISVERLAIAMNVMTNLAKSKQPNPTLLNHARDAIIHWQGEYPAQLRVLGDSSADTLQSAGRLFKPGGPYTNSPALLEAMLPTISAHLKELKSTGKIPNAFAQDIYDAYAKLPNKPTSL